MENVLKKRSSFADVPRVPSGILGLDDMIEGGFEKNSLNIVCGETGSGKTLFATQFVYYGASRYNDNSIFISLEESKDEIKRRMARFGFDISALESSGKLAIYSYSPKDVNKFIEDLPQIESAIKKNKITRLALDSLTTYSLFFGNNEKKILEILSLFDRLKKMNCTSVLTAELKLASKILEGEEGVSIEHLSDSIISLYSTRKGDIRDIGLEVIKMRGTNHSRKIAPIKIIQSGLIVYPDMPFLK
ncbi:MAG: AAA family ATPase [Candidatus Micrarchaeota archaeon]|nr:AAA family ATPase [Candidatus Micrarchaeota archaeon]